MPHQCTDCARVFDDGSKEMLSGCPDCGGNKFQFHPDGTTLPDQPSDDPPEPPERPGEGSVAQKVGSAATTVRDLVGSSPSSPPDSSPSESPSPAPSQPSSSAVSDPSGTSTATEPSDAAVTSGDAAGTQTADTGASSAETTATSAEDEAQASARSELVSPDELPPAPERTHSARPRPVMDGRTDPPASADETSTPREDRPDLSELRAELNDQFESIKVLEPGQYELNLMSLYDREEYIIALQEDGKYTIQVPERWKDD